MLRPGMSWCAVVLAALLALSWSAAVALAGEDGALSTDPSGAPVGYRGVRAVAPSVPEGLDDALQPLEEGAPPASARVDASDLSMASLLETVARVPLWQRLTGLARSQRPNAAIEVELGAGAGPADRLLAAQVSELWSEDRCDEAIAALRAFEEAGGRCALGIAWKEGMGPAATLGAAATASGGADVRIGTRTAGRMTSLDFDAETGYLFAVIGFGATTGGEAFWSVNRSTDDGDTWIETYLWYAGATGGLIDMSAVVVGDYVYVGYVPGDVQTEYRLRRCSATTGLSDATYGYQVILDGGANTFTEVTVASNAESFDNRIYCFAIQSDHALRFAWDVATDGLTFTEQSPSVTDAASALDATWNPGYTDRFLYVSYVTTTGFIYAQHNDGSVWTPIYIASASGVAHRTGVCISAYEDNVICAYEYLFTNGRGIAYRISYDAGDSWNGANLAEPDGATVSAYQCPDVDARDGHGTAAIYSAEMGEPDAVYYHKRAGYAPGGWDAREQFNDHDLLTGTRLTLSHVPVLGPTCFSHGAVYFYGTTPYFDLPVLGAVDVAPPAVTAGVRLFPPAPSPFADRATVRFTLPVAGHASLQVFNALGRHVATLADGPMEAGAHAIPLDGRGLGSGVYFCRLTAGPAQRVSRFVVIH